MRSLMFLLTMALVCWLASATPINPKRLLINRPTEEPYYRARRSPQYVKGGIPVKGHSLLSPQELNLRKGEYMCGDKVCKLKPGEMPKGCVHCQYPI